MCAGLQGCGSAPHPDAQVCPYRDFNCSSPGGEACSLPASCCIHPGGDAASVNKQCGSGALRLDEDAARAVVHLQGCGPPLRRWLRGTVRAAGAYMILVVAVQGAELLLANQLVKALAVRRAVAGTPELQGRGASPPTPAARAQG